MALAIVTGCRTNVPEGEFLVNVDGKGVILDGHDPVTFFTKGSPEKGKPDLVHNFKGATYWFATEENRQLFAKDPEKYAPQYGGFCAYAMSRDKLRPIDPEIFQVVNGRLMLQHSTKALNLFNEDLDNNIRLADEYWPGLVEKKAGKAVAYDEPAN